MIYCDAHLHSIPYEKPLLHVSCGTRPNDWDDVPDGIKCYGVHPWYSDEWNDDVEKTLIDFAKNNNGIGEIGIDSIKGKNNQYEVFEKQMTIASDYGSLATIHNVDSDDFIMKIIKKYGKGCRSIILHSFSSDSLPIKELTKYGCYFSVSPRLLASPSRAKSIIDKIPNDRLLLESDYPYIKADFSYSSHYQSVAEMKGINVNELCSFVYENLKRAVL